MSIIRSKRKRHNYSVIDNTGLIDSKLTWKATGLLAFLMTKPDNWEINIKALSHNKKDGRDSTIKALDDLIAAGYVHRTVNRIKGRFNTEYLVFETPADMEEWLESDDGKENNPQPERENRNGKTGTGKPERENRNGKTGTENPIQVITDIDITELEITEKQIPSISPSTQQEEKEERGGIALLKEEKEVEQVNSISAPRDSFKTPLADQKEIPANSNTNKSTLEEKDSAAPAAPVVIPTTGVISMRQQINASRRNDDQFAPLLSWRNSRKINDFKEEFLTYLQEEHLPNTPAYKGKKITRANAVSWISSREYEQRLGEIHAQWDGSVAWNQDLTAKVEARAQVKTTDTPPQQPEQEKFERIVQPYRGKSDFLNALRLLAKQKPHKHQQYKLLTDEEQEAVAEEFFGTGVIRIEDTLEQKEQAEAEKKAQDAKFERLRGRV